MKKFICGFLAFLMLSMCPAGVYAAQEYLNLEKAETLLQKKENGNYILKKEIPTNVKIFKSEGKKGLINANTNKIIIPAIYDKIVHLSSDAVKVKQNGKWGALTNNNRLILDIKYDKVAYMDLSRGKNDIKNSVYLGKENGSWYAKTPGREPEDLFKRTYSANQEFSWLKFRDYPTYGIIPYKFLGKYGFIICKGDNARLLEADYDDVYFQDSDTALFQHLGVSIADVDNIIVKKGKKWGIIDTLGKTVVDFKYDNIVMATTKVKEEVTLDENNIYFNYKNMTFPQNDKLIAKKGKTTYVINKKGEVLLSKPTAPNKIKLKDYDLDSNNFLEKIYKENNEIAFVKFKNYPTEGMFLTQKGDKFGLIISNKEGNKKIPAIYDEFYFQDTNTGIFKQLGITYSNQNRIVAKKDGLWGIIDKDNNVIVNFDYNSVLGLGAVPDIKIELKDDGVDYTYQNTTFPQEDLLLVGKDNLFGVINKEGKEIIPLKHPFIKAPNSRVIGLENGDKLAYNPNGTKVDSTGSFVTDVGDAVAKILMVPVSIVGMAIILPLVPVFIILLLWLMSDMGC